MSQRRLWIGACVLAALLVFPRTGDAGIGEIILEMSGPRMIGFGLECRLTFSGSWESCKVATPTPLLFAENQPDVRMWLSVGGKFFFSVDKTINGQHYETGEVKMWSFDPMLEFESKAWPVDHSNLDLQLYHGVLGVSYNVFHGADFPTFSNVALKLRPAGIVIPFSRNWAVDVSYDIRLYPRAVTAEDFGKVPLPDAEPSREAVHSIGVGFRWRLNKR
jgi:hypothetical protein